jgi:hypothetical protein
VPGEYGYLTPEIGALHMSPRKKNCDFLENGSHDFD